MLLENLSESKIQTIINLNNYNVVFGGSIALCAYDIINRPIKDIDVIINSPYHRIYNLRVTGASRSFINVDNDRVADFDRTLLKSTIDVNFRFDHLAGFFFNENICIFSLKTDILYTNYSFNYDGNQYTIKLLHPDYIIAAKSSYAISHNIKKHILDCDAYRSWDQFNNFEFKQIPFGETRPRRRVYADWVEDIFGPAVDYWEM